MIHNIPLPSKYGAGTTYEGDGTIKHIVTPDDHDVDTYKIPINRPRIVRASGSIAVESSSMERETLSSVDADSSGHATLGDAYGHPLQSVRLSDKNDMHTGSSQTPNQRQQSLDIAAAENIVRAAEAAGMTVDQWNANGRPMKGSYSGK